MITNVTELYTYKPGHCIRVQIPRRAAGVLNSYTIQRISLISRSVCPAETARHASAFGNRFAHGARFVIAPSVLFCDLVVCVHKSVC